MFTLCYYDAIMLPLNLYYAANNLSCYYDTVMLLYKVYYDIIMMLLILKVYYAAIMFLLLEYYYKNYLDMIILNS